MVRSWVIRITAMPYCACRSRISFRICACTVTSSAVVGSSAISTSGLLASAMAIITRWRWPPESWCGYCSSRASGSGICTSLRELQRPRQRLLAAHALCSGSPRRSGCRPCRPGSASSSAPGRSSRCGRRAASRICRSANLSDVACRRAAISAVGEIVARLGSSPMTARAVTDLPEPDSPTIAMVSPR